MKKTIFTLSIILISIAAHSQDSFIKNYKSYIISKNGVLSERKEINLFVIFNENKIDDIAIYNLKKVEKYHIIETEESEAEDGSKYKLMYCIDLSNGKEKFIQLFELAFRVFNDEDYIEYN